MKPYNDQADLALRIRRDPGRFVRDFFGETLVGKQLEVLEALRDHRETYVRSAHDVGKTFLAARAIVWFLLSHPGDSIVISTAPVWAQVEGQIWREVALAYAKSRVNIGGRLLTTRLELGPKWYAIGLATDPGTAVNLQGYHATHVLVVMDEADGIAPQIWTALDSVRTSAGAKLLAIGNPLDPTSEFKRRHDRALTQSDAKCIKIAADDVLPLTDGGRHPYLLQRAWVDDKRSRWGETSALYLAKVLAEWPDQGSDVLIPISWLERARGRSVRKGLRVYGVDVARFGSSRTVRTLLAGNWLEWTRATEREDTMQTAGRVYVDVEQYAPVAVGIDDTGVGGAVTDRLRQLYVGTTRSVTAVNFGARAWDDSRFANRASEIYWLTRSAFEENLVGFDMTDPESIDELVVELNRPKYDTDDKGRIRVDKYGLTRGHTEDEERVARSPDRADSFVIAYSLGGKELRPQPQRPKTEMELLMAEVLERRKRDAEGSDDPWTL